VDSGFDPEGLVTMHVALPSHRYPTNNSRIEFFENLAQRLRGTPGIRHVTATVSAPPSAGAISFGTMEVEGRGRVDDKPAIIPNGTVAPSYFEALRIPIVEGRGFLSDEPEDQVIVSRGMAERYWPDGGAVGSRFRLSPKWPWLTVVGVAGSVQVSTAGDERTTAVFYRPWIKRPAPAPPPTAAAATPAAARRSYDYRHIIVRADDPSAAIPLVKGQIWALDPQQPVEKTVLVADSYGTMFAKQRFLLVVMGAFAAVALLLTAAGLFGVLSQLVVQRTREIGIRVALGARPSDVMRLVISRGMVLAGAGAALGIAGALGLVKTISALLYGIRPTDPVSFAVVTALLLAVALVACWLPTRAAMRVDPAVALRTE
jgi:predicted permease